MTVRTTTQTLDDALVRATALLADVSESPRLDAEVLLTHTLNVPRPYLHAHGRDHLAENMREIFESYVERRLVSEPVAYITGTKEFYGRTFAVDRSTLIPRPDSEILIDRVLDYVRTSRAVPARIADVGTGSGALGITLALELPSPFVRLSDVSDAALRIAEQNVKHYHLEDTVVLENDFLLSKHTQPLDLVVANLPYVTEDRYRATAPDVREYEPYGALVPSSSDTDGLSLYRALLEQLPELLTTQSGVFFEADPEQMPALRLAVKEVFPGASIQVAHDLSGQERVLSFSV